MSSSPSESGSSASEGGASGLGGGVGLARHALEKGSWLQPQFGQWGGEVGPQPEMGGEVPPFGQVGFWHLCAAQVWRSAQKGHEGCIGLQRWEACPNR